MIEFILAVFVLGVLCLGMLVLNFIWVSLLWAGIKYYFEHWSEDVLDEDVFVIFFWAWLILVPVFIGQVFHERYKTLRLEFNAEFLSDYFLALMNGRRNDEQ